MIKLFDNWCIDVDERNFTLYQLLGVKKVLKNGTETEENITKVYGYFISLLSALTALRDVITRQRLQDGIYTLDGALRVIREEDERIRKLWEEIRCDG